MDKIKIFLIILSFVFAAFFSLFTVLALEEDTGNSRLTAASPLYFLKAAWESFELKFTSQPRDKMMKRLEFANRRLNEVKTLVSQDSGLIQPTLERYMGEINSLPDEYQENDELGLKVKQSLELHIKVLEQAYDELNSPKAKMAIRYVINRILRRQDLSVLSKSSICKFLEREAQSSSLNATEKAVLSERVDICLKSIKPDF